MLDREIRVTSEGSKTLYIPEWNEHYHSNHGVIQEAKHVFIKNGLEAFLGGYPEKKEINILEIGFGTGINAMCSLVHVLDKNYSINYYTIEKFPVLAEELEALEYYKLFEIENSKELYSALHSTEWSEKTQIYNNFYLNKINADFFEMDMLGLPAIDIVYYDAFGARVQPELWEESIFSKVYSVMNANSLLTTYSSKGSARRAMQAVGFEVSKLEGPLGKREMVNAWKI